MSQSARSIALIAWHANPDWPAAVRPQWSVWLTLSVSSAFRDRIAGPATAETILATTDASAM